MKSLFKILILATFFFVAHSTHAATLQRPPNNLGLVGYWSFNEGTSTIASDFSGRGNNGTLTSMDANTDWVAGKFGKALDFDGTNDYVSIANNTNLKPSLPVTISAWVYFTDTDIHPIFTNDATSDFYYGVTLQIGTAPNVVSVQYGDGGSPGANNRRTKIGTTVLNTNQWYHVAAVVRGATDMDVYVNGINDGGTYSGAGDGVAYTSAGGAVGRYDSSSSASNDYFAKGKVDELRFYNRALSSTEVAALYGTGAVKYTAPNNRGIVAHWSFDEGTTTSAGDFSGNGNTGTLTNMDANTDWVNGKLGKALDFDGTNDYINTSSGLLNGLTNATISFWIYYRGGTGIWGQGDGSTSSFMQTTRLFFRSGDSQDWGITNPFTVNEWQHITITRNTSSLSIYKNGVLVQGPQADTGLAISAAASTNFNIGRVPAGSSGATSYTNSIIDDFRIYNRVLSDAEIASLAKTGGSQKLSTSQNNKITDGLVGLWSFNGPDLSTATAYDRSGSGFNGTLNNGPKPASGKVGQAMTFDGVDDYITITSSSLHDSSQTFFTASTWVKLPSLGIERYFFSKRGNVNRGWGFGITSTNQLFFVGNGVSGSTGSTAANVINDTNWHHVVFVRDNSNFYIYLDGVVQTLTTVPTNNPQAGSSSVFLGGLAPATGGVVSFYSYTLDEPRIYNRALSASEAKQLYLMGK